MLASVFVGMSLDGFIARPDGRFDFLTSAEGGPHGYEEFMATVDALLIGRGTYEVVLGMGGWFYGKKPVFVLSSKPNGLGSRQDLSSQICATTSPLIVISPAAASDFTSIGT